MGLSGSGLDSKGYVKLLPLFADINANKTRHLLIKVMRQIRESRVSIPRFLTVLEVAELLRLKPRTIYEMVAQGRIPHRRAGRVLIFELNEILSWTQSEGKPGDKEN